MSGLGAVESVAVGAQELLAGEPADDLLSADREHWQPIFIADGECVDGILQCLVGAQL